MTTTTKALLWVGGGRDDGRRNTAADGGAVVRRFVVVSFSTLPTMALEAEKKKTDSSVPAPKRRSRRPSCRRWKAEIRSFFRRLQQRREADPFSVCFLYRRPPQLIQTVDGFVWVIDDGSTAAS